MSDEFNKQIGRDRKSASNPPLPDQQPEKLRHSVERVGNCAQGQRSETKGKGQRGGKSVPGE